MSRRFARARPPAVDSLDRRDVQRVNIHHTSVVISNAQPSQHWKNHRVVRRGNIIRPPTRRHDPEWLERNLCQSLFQQREQDSLRCTSLRR